MNAAGSDPTDVQVTQYIGLMRAIFANYEDAFYQHLEGLLDDVAFESWKRTALSGMGSVQRRVAWKWMRGSFGSEFETFMDRQMAEIPVAKGPFLSAERWKAELAKEGSSAA